jgi:hypothetical protein
MNDFNINDTELDKFHKVLECLKLSYEIELAKSEPKWKAPKEEKKSSGKKQNNHETDSLSSSHPAKRDTVCSMKLWIILQMIVT